MTNVCDYLDLKQIASEVSSCKKCPLAEGRTNVVFGGGSENARIMIIGEAPGKSEDESGEPFVGSAGRLLDELLQIAGLTRNEIYIANVLKCRPPSNRDPKVEEIEQCSDYLRGQTRLINPDIIVTLGNFATRFILKTNLGITALRGKLHHAGRFKVFPVFHPAATMYSPNKKAILETDFLELGRLLGEIHEL